MSDGAFPEKLSNMGFHDLFMKSYSSQISVRMEGAEGIFVTDMSEKAKEVFRSCRGGLRFIEEVKGIGSWHYAGKDVRFGEKDKTVCWWKLPGSETFRVVYGDLTIRDVPADKLPVR